MTSKAEAYNRGFDDAITELIDIVGTMPYYLTTKEVITEMKKVRDRNENG